MPERALCQPLKDQSLLEVIQASAEDLDIEWSSHRQERYEMLCSLLWEKRWNVTNGNPNERSDNNQMPLMLRINHCKNGSIFNSAFKRNGSEIKRSQTPMLFCVQQRNE